MTRSIPAPMLATAGGKPFSSPDWIFETRFDGYRCLARFGGGAVELRTRSGLDCTASGVQGAAAPQTRRRLAWRRCCAAGVSFLAVQHCRFQSVTTENRDARQYAGSTERVCNPMNVGPRDLAARYADAIQFEKDAWLALQAEGAGTRDRAAAWALWKEATYRTNLAWSQLSSHTLSKAHQGKQAFPDLQPAGEQAAAPPHYTR